MISITSKSSSLGLFGVLPEKLKGVRDFVSDALARTMVSGAKLKVFDSIIASISVLVMNGLLGTKRSPNVLLHDVSVFQHKFSLASGDGRRDADIGIASLEMARVSTSFELRPGFSNLRCYLAGLTAKRMLTPVHNTASVDVALSGMDNSALPAGKKSFSLRNGFLSRAIAPTTAIFRVMTKPLMVGRNVGLPHGEGFAAMLARKFNGSFLGSRSAIRPFVNSEALNATESLCRSGVLGLERGAAVLANLVYRHNKEPSMLASKQDVMVNYLNYKGAY